ncbi:MAG: S8 family serine peptidase [Phycisphaerae bacterium]|nr:S8 family serine peptidase [Phycisphaerae bacterium]
MPKRKYILIMGIVCAVSLCCDLQKACALAESTAQGGSNARAVHDLGQIGENINIGLIAGRNVATTHEAFYDKDINGNPIGSTHAFNYDFTDDGNVPVSHDTWMAGIAISRGGFLHPNDIGVAPGANLHCARIANNANEIDFSWFNNALNRLITEQNCKVIVTGVSLLLTPDGKSNYTLLYDYYAYQHNVTFANAAGNENTQIAVFGDAYNGITTGGFLVSNPTAGEIYDKVGAASGSGPTSDGRQKPDVGAPAQRQIVPTTGSTSAWTDPNWVFWYSNDGHTSLSGPHTAGTAALLLGLADDTPDPCDSQDEVIKAVIVNSTFPNILDKAGNPTDPAVWNKDKGYGRIDALRAYQILDSNRLPIDTNTTDEKGWAFDTIYPSQQHTYTIYVPRRYRLTATLTWDRRVVWTDKRPYDGEIDAGELHPYLADLDLEIYEPGNTSPIFNKQLADFDPNDNLVKADIPLTISGQYTIKVVNDPNSEDADYGLAFELLPPLPADFDLNYIVDYDDLIEIADNWLLPVSDSDADLFEDGFIDFSDFAIFAESWLNSDPAYYQD